MQKLFKHSTFALKTPRVLIKWYTFPKNKCLYSYTIASSTCAGHGNVGLYNGGMNIHDPEHVTSLHALGMRLSSVLGTFNSIIYQLKYKI